VRSLTETVADGDEFDYVIVTLKALPDVYDVAEIIRPAVTIGKTCIVLIQNGLGIEDPVAKTFPMNPLLSVVAYIGVSQLSSGRIDMQGTELLKIGIFPKVMVDHAKQVEARDRFVGVLRRGGVDVEVIKDIQADRWQKLIWNGSFSPISVLTLGDTQLIVNNPEQKALLVNLMRDVIRVAAAHGYIFDEEATITEMFAKTARVAPGYKSSMLLDLEKGQPMEVEVILGNAYREAKAKGVAVPYLETIYTLCNAVNQREKKAREMKAAQNTPV
ncbi:ketopantoate reductase PanE/ApbA C terminal-domain-containing protein, partial [Endogone sp. FLAS-F59071]